MVNCCQFTIIWCNVDRNTVTTPTFLLSLGSVAGVFAMLDIMIEVWFLCERRDE
jgi:hypothetical protein